MTSQKYIKKQTNPHHSEDKTPSTDSFKSVIIKSAFTSHKRNNVISGYPHKLIDKVNLKLIYASV